MQFLDKKHIVDTEDSIIVESQNTINESQPNSKIVTNDDALNSTLPSTSEGSNFCKPKQTETATAEWKNVQARRKRIQDEDRDFEREMMNMFKENTKLMQNDDMSFFCSLLPILNTFSNHQKLLFRSAVLQKAIEISSGSSEV
ncbi:MADF domain-containing protein [Aphis craccivora]|uniref:MADF domain-containing protein n=1 Tax=Aphis craccivora TaxID=307492 RepID=A0A6G0W1L0_APHCR|nr:MADF domain-containing protein [Aphis craccivora]